MLQSTLCYLERGDAYLMLHRVKKEHDANRDKWIGIGGKFEDKESPEDCLLRECREETGLTLTDYRYRGLVTFVNTEWPTEYMHLFTATDWTGEPHVCDEGDLAWIKKAELLTLPMWEGDQIFLRLLDSDEPFFSLKLCYAGDRLESAVLNGKQAGSLSPGKDWQREWCAHRREDAGILRFGAGVGRPVGGAASGRGRVPEGGADAGQPKLDAGTALPGASAGTPGYGEGIE